jgi:hypothetical protein
MIYSLDISHLVITGSSRNGIAVPNCNDNHTDNNANHRETTRRE